jgi:hypothetical protein
VLLLSLDRPGDRLCLSDLILAPLKMNLLALFFYVTLLTSPSSTNILPSTVPVYLPRDSSLQEFNHYFASPAQFTQPLIVLSIPAPHVLVFGFVFNFLNDRNASDIYRPFMGYTLIWAGVFLSCAALAGLSRINTYVTRACTRRSAASSPPSYFSKESSESSLSFRPTTKAPLVSKASLGLGALSTGFGASFSQFC